MKKKTLFSKYLAWAQAQFPKKLWAVAFVSAMVLDPYGSVNSLLEKSNPWRTFYEDGPILAEIRVSREPATNCKAWESAFYNNTREVRLGRPKSSVQNAQWSTWLPFEDREKESIEECHEKPCEIKLGEVETKQMATAKKEDRISVFLSSIVLRGEAYQKDQTRSPYEYEGGISDPWKTFEKLGLKSDIPMPSSSNIGLRKLDFHNDRARIIRQLVDRRVASSKDQTEATLWIRDIYTNHYFDSWGEWGNITCDPVKKEATLTLAVTLEFDVLKNSGLLASATKRSGKNAMRDLMIAYLNQWAGEVKDLGEKNSRR